MVSSGYQYRIYWKNSKLVNWVFVKDKYGTFKGTLKTTLQYDMTGTKDSRLHQNIADTKAKVKRDTSRNSAREGDSVPVHTICKGEFSDIYVQGYD